MATVESNGVIWCKETSTRISATREGLPCAVEISLIDGEAVLWRIDCEEHPVNSVVVGSEGGDLATRAAEAVTHLVEQEQIARQERIRQRKAEEVIDDFLARLSYTNSL